MADNKPGIDTFHRVREQCEQANADAWRAFLSLYSPLGLHLLGMYAPDRAAAARFGRKVWEETLRRLAENNFERFRGTARQSEREFLARRASAAARDARGSGRGGRRKRRHCGHARRRRCAGRVGRAQPGSIRKGSRRFSKGCRCCIRRCFSSSWPVTATAPSRRCCAWRRAWPKNRSQRLSPDFAAALSAQKDRCLWPSEWLAILRQARAAKKETCPELHQILRVHDGQVSWYDKEPVEKHVSGCLYCLERWTALREVGYWRRMAPAVSPEQIEEWLRVLPVRAEEKKKKSLLRRVLG